MNTVLYTYREDGSQQKPRTSKEQLKILLWKLWRAHQIQKLSVEDSDTLHNYGKTKAFLELVEN